MSSIYMNPQIDKPFELEWYIIVKKDVHQVLQDLYPIATGPL